MGNAKKKMSIVEIDQEIEKLSEKITKLEMRRNEVDNRHCYETCSTCGASFLKYKLMEEFCKTCKTCRDPSKCKY